MKYTTREENDELSDFLYEEARPETVFHLMNASYSILIFIDVSSFGYTKNKTQLAVALLVV